MIKRIAFLVLFIAVTCGIFAQKNIKVMTFNIRFDNPKDAPNDWPNRKDKVASQILFHEADIIGVQEALHNQLEDMLERLTDYRYVGVGRDDGKKAGEYSAIFYNTTTLNLQQVETFWLSETPSVAGSKSWDAAITRIVTWAKFKDKKSGKTFYHFNTHFDHVGKVARAESARIILHAVDSIAGGFPAIVTGDFNATIDDEPMQILLSEENLPKLVDTKVVSTTRHYGPGGTFNAFGSKENNTKPIDHILFMGKWKVTKHATLSQTWGGLFSSDHFPVLAQMSVQKK